MLAKEQYISICILLGLAIGTWFFIIFWPQKPLPRELTPAYQDSLRVVQDSLRRDSLQLAWAKRDSLRGARWEHYKDSTKRADDRRFALWNAERKARYDSFFLADSLWKDSVGRIPRAIKKDTILDLNTADTTELKWIRGIGRYIARQIVKYREELGGFYSPEQLKDERLQRWHLDSVIPHFIASPEKIRKINVNSCSTDYLQRHPYLRYEQAKAIYELRRKSIRIRSIDELRQLNELDSTDIERLRWYLQFE